MRKERGLGKGEDDAVAIKKTAFTARPKRTSDGAVSARYTKTKTAKSGQEDAKEKKTASRTADKAAPKAVKPAEKKAEKKTEKKTDKKPARKTETSKQAVKKTEAKAPVRRAVYKEEAPKEKTKRESGRVRREREKTEAAMRDRARAVSRGAGFRVTMIVLLTVVFTAGGLLLAAYKTPGSMDTQALTLMAMLIPMCVLTALALPRITPMDPLIMALTNFLCCVGIVVLYTVAPQRGMLQANYYLLGVAAMCIVSQIIRKTRRFHTLTVVSMLSGVVFLVLPLAFGQWAYGAKNWVNLPVIGSFQPSELVKISLVLAMAYYFSAHRTVLQMMPAILFAGACLLLLMLQRDLGTALIYYATALVLFYAACGNVPLTLIGLGGGAGAAVLGYRMFAHVKARVAMWRNPWSDPLDKGYQIIQALLAIGSGGLFGVGLGQGTPEMIPAYFNDFIFAVICEQLGIVFGLLVLAVYVLLIVRGVTVITASRRSFDMLLGCGVLAMLSIQTFMIVGGVIKMLPLTGVTMPFLSYGGSSMLSCMMMIGILHGIAGRAQENMEEDVLSLKA